jgi:hypothetical protein
MTEAHCNEKHSISSLIATTSVFFTWKSNSLVKTSSPFIFMLFTYLIPCLVQFFRLLLLWYAIWKSWRFLQIRLDPIKIREFVERFITRTVWTKYQIHRFSLVENWIVFCLAYSVWLSLCHNSKYQPLKKRSLQVGLSFRRERGGWRASSLSRASMSQVFTPNFYECMEWMHLFYWQCTNGTNISLAR